MGLGQDSLSERTHPKLLVGSASLEEKHALLGVSILGDRANRWCARFHRSCDSRSRRRKDSVRGLPDSVPHFPSNPSCARSNAVSRGFTGTLLSFNGRSGWARTASKLVKLQRP